jgi:hypothetical protein
MTARHAFKLVKNLTVVRNPDRLIFLALKITFQGQKTPSSANGPAKPAKDHVPLGGI